MSDQVTEGWTSAFDGQQATIDDDLRLKIALRAADIGIWEWDLATGAMRYSDRARKIFGFLGDDPITLDRVRATIHPDDVTLSGEQARRAIDPALRSKSPYKFRLLRESDGEICWALAHGEAIFSGEGAAATALRYIGTIQDITDQVDAEQALIESEARLRLAIEAAGMAVWEFDGSTGKLKTSPELNRLFGFPDDADPEIDDFRARYGPGEREKVQEAAKDAMAAGESKVQVEFRARLPDGSLRWRLLRAQLELDNNGAFERVIGVLMDIDEQKRGEERQKLLSRELNHRVKNSLSVVQSLASQTFRNDNLGPDSLNAFRNRLYALAKANDVLIDEDWSNFKLRSLIEEITSPYRDSDNDPFIIDGDHKTLPPHLTVPLAMALHELCTNAAKYGALSVDEGRVAISWRDDAHSRIELTWREIDGPPTSAPQRKGFGTRLLSERLSPQLGEVQLRFDRDGLVCRMQLATENSQAA